MKAIVIIPCYNAEHTIKKVLNETLVHFEGDILCCDDCSTDNTVEVISQYNVELLTHNKNRGYGANQKTLFDRALEKGADIVVMIHGDYQYTPKLAKALSEMLKTNLFDIVCASRILSGSSPVRSGMPVLKFIVNRILTLFQNLILRSKLSEFHSGYRAFNREFLTKVPYHNFQDGFSFDNQILVWAIKNGYRIGEMSCPTRYEKNSSSIGFRKGIAYAFACITGTFKKF